MLDNFNYNYAISTDSRDKKTIKSFQTHENRFVMFFFWLFFHTDNPATTEEARGKS